MYDYRARIARRSRKNRFSTAGAHIETTTFGLLLSENELTKTLKKETRKHSESSNRRREEFRVLVLAERIATKM